MSFKKLFSLLPSALVTGRLSVDVGNTATVTNGAGTSDIGTVQPYAQAGSSVDGKTADITGTADTALIAAQGGGIRTYITTLIIQNSHATVGTWVNVKDGTTSKLTVFCKAGGGGASVPLPKALRGSANTAWNVAAETTGANVRVSAVGYTSTV